MLEELSWSWSYGSWIYNYLCNQWPSPLTLWVWIPLVQGVLDRTLRDKVCQWLSTGWCVLQHPMTRDHIFNIHPVQLSYICLEFRLDRIWWYSHGRSINECWSNDCRSYECQRNNCRSNDCRSNETTPNKQTLLMMDWFLVFNANFSNISAIVYHGDQF